MTQDFVRVRVEEGIAWLTMSEPQRLNPVTLARIAELHRAAMELSARDDVRVVVVTGEGRGFCSGADITDPELRTTPIFAPASGSLAADSDGVWTLRAVRQPVIAMVNGAAVGYGCELALQADIAVAAASARFSLPFARLGTVTDTGAGTWLLPRLVGHQVAAELLFTGRFVSAAEAVQLGLVTRAVPDDDLIPTTRALAESIASNAPESLYALKRMLIRGSEQDAAAHTLLQYGYFNSMRADLDTALARLARKDRG